MLLYHQLDWLNAAKGALMFKHCLIVFLVSMVPIIELRGRCFFVLEISVYACSGIFEVLSGRSEMKRNRGKIGKQ